MVELSKAESLNDSSCNFPPERDYVSASTAELLDSTHYLQKEADGDDEELLNGSCWDEICSEKMGFHRDPSESHLSLPFDTMPSPSGFPSSILQVPVHADTMTSGSSSLTENDRFSLTRKGAGLVNLGNTCFLNAVLQCFIHTVPLLERILLDTHAMSCQCPQEVFCVLCAMRELVELSLTSTDRSVEPWKIVNNLRYFSPGFERFQQEDAHEFLQCFLERLGSCYQFKGNDCTLSESNNLVKTVFGGCLVSKLRCCNCGHFSDTYEASIDLSLEIEDVDNLITALQSFTKVETIEDSENKFTCERCREKVPIEKQLKFDQIPSVTAFHLKRFKNDGCFVEKIDTHVAFPLEFDLLPFTDSGKMNVAELRYTLYAIIVHIGLTSTSGHYYCFIRLSPHTWCKFDDSRVVQVDEAFVLSQEAYILFYAKEGISWFQNFIETNKFCAESSIFHASPKSVLDKVDISVPPPTLYKNCCNYNEVSDASGSKDTETEGKEDMKSILRCNISDNSEDKDNQVTKSVSVTPIMRDSLNELQKGFTRSSLDKVNHSEEVCASGNNRNTIPPTPLRSPSLEIYREDSPDMLFSIPCGNIRPVNRISCKRQLVKEMDDLEARQACSLIKKSIPGSRGRQLLAALKVSGSEGSVNKKKSRRMESSSRKDYNSPSTYRHASTRPVLHPLLARGFK